jgi:hypothetical protein
MVTLLHSLLKLIARCNMVTLFSNRLARYNMVTLLQSFLKSFGTSQYAYPTALLKAIGTLEYGYPTPLSNLLARYNLVTLLAAILVTLQHYLLNSMIIQ